MSYEESDVAWSLPSFEGDPAARKKPVYTHPDTI